MKIIMLIVISLITNTGKGQSASDLVEGGKTLVELISLFKKNKTNVSKSLAADKDPTDSCMIKQRSDLCFKNSLTKDLIISLYRRNDTGYENIPYTMKVLTKKQECWYELNSGIYKYKLETDAGVSKQLFSEGEIRLLPCDSMKREIKE